MSADVTMSVCASKHTTPAYRLNFAAIIDLVVRRTTTITSTLSHYRRYISYYWQSIDYLLIDYLID